MSTVFHRILARLLACASLLAAVPVAAETHLTFGIYTSDKPSAVVRQFRPVLNAIEQGMSQRLGEPVHIQMKVANSYEQGMADLVSGKVDFSRFGPASYVLARQSLPALHLLAMETNKGGRSFNGVIAVRADSGIHTLADLKGKTFAFGDDQSTIGRYLSQLLLQENGIKAGDLAKYQYLDRHDAVGAAVADGRFSAGALKEGTLKKQVATGLPLKVLATFPNVTKPWIAHPSLSPRLFASLQETMLGLDDPEIFKQLASDGADGFGKGEDAEYDRIRAAIRSNPEFFK